ncbi:hypothetical protein VTI28DRAFT_4236 [Corynascus sepedonium]
MFGVAPKFGEDECTQSMTRSPTKYEVPGQFDLKHIPRDDTVPIEDIQELQLKIRDSFIMPTSYVHVSS